MNHLNLRFFLLLLVATAAPALISIPSEATMTTENISITQTPNDTIVENGDTVTFVVKLYVPQEYNGPAVDVDLPSTWQITSQSSDPSGRYKHGSNQWIWLNSGNKTIEYSVKLPETTSKRSHRIVINGLGINPKTNTVESDTAVSFIEINSSTTPAETQSPIAEQTTSVPSATSELVTTQRTASSPDRSNTTQSSGQTGFGVLTFIMSVVVLTMVTVTIRTIR